MVPTNSIVIFLRHNDHELRLLIGHLCKKQKYAGSFDDLVQDFYFKLLTSDTLQKYNRHFTTSKKFTSCRLSSYLYPVIKNFITGKMRSSDYRNAMKKVSNYDSRTQTYYEMEDLIKNGVDESYQETVDYNMYADSHDGRSSDLKSFYEDFKDTKEDRKFAVKQCAEKGVPQASLSRLFKYIYEGYTNREIAKMFGVSGMYISFMKQLLAENLAKYGFSKDLYGSHQMSKMSADLRD